jgi:hypothetical protein
MAKPNSKLQPAKYIQQCDKAQLMHCCTFVNAVQQPYVESRAGWVQKLVVGLLWVGALPPERHMDLIAVAGADLDARHFALKSLCPAPEGWPMVLLELPAHCPRCNMTHLVGKCCAQPGLTIQHLPVAAAAVRALVTTETKSLQVCQG